MMLIATLPTFVSAKDLVLSERILRHPLIDGVRYNTGGASPYRAKTILEKLQALAEKHDKKFFVDLEGRQVRIAKWTPFSAGMVVLNRGFEIELPAKIHFRGLGWFDVLNADLKNNKIFFDGGFDSPRYYLGESQSVHIVAKRFNINGYLGESDYEFISGSMDVGIKSFMLSFVESLEDIYEFSQAFGAANQKGIGSSEMVIKIESLRGVEFVKKLSPALTKELWLMAARDDLFLAHLNCKRDFLDSLKTIISKDPNAILASKIMSGFETGDSLTVGDLSDMVLMSQAGYKNFMFSDELSRKFDQVMLNWENIVVPLLSK